VVGGPIGGFGEQDFVDLRLVVDAHTRINASSIREKSGQGRGERRWRFDIRQMRCG